MNENTAREYIDLLKSRPELMYFYKVLFSLSPKQFDALRQIVHIAEHELQAEKTA